MLYEFLSTGSYKAILCRSPETVLGRTQQDWARDIEGVEGRPHQAVSLSRLENP